MNRLDKIKSDFHCAKVGETHGDTDIEYLLSIIEQAEKALKLASKQIKDDAEDIAIEYGYWSENMEDSDVLKEVKSALKSIQERDE